MRRPTLTTVIGIAVLIMYATLVAAASPAHLEQRARAAMRLHADAARGKTLYLDSCSSCHGGDAQGDVTRLIPSLAGQRVAYLIKHLAEFSDPAPNATQMHPVTVLSEVADPQAWADLARYLTDCAPLQVAAGNSEMVARGARSYRRWCVSCHAKDARGDDTKFVPSLRHQHYAYLLKQLQWISAQHRLSGAPDTMGVLDSLDSEAMAGIADYVVRMNDTQTQPAPVREARD